jgi:hypothetical protein
MSDAEVLAAKNNFDKAKNGLKTANDHLNTCKANKQKATGNKAKAEEAVDKAKATHDAAKLKQQTAMVLLTSLELDHQVEQMSQPQQPQQSQQPNKKQQQQLQKLQATQQLVAVETNRVKETENNLKSALADLRKINSELSELDRLCAEADKRVQEAEIQVKEATGKLQAVEAEQKAREKQAKAEKAEADRKAAEQKAKAEQEAKDKKAKEEQDAKDKKAKEEQEAKDKKAKAEQEAQRKETAKAKQAEASKGIYRLTRKGSNTAHWYKQGKHPLEMHRWVKKKAYVYSDSAKNKPKRWSFKTSASKLKSYKLADKEERGWFGLVTKRKHLTPTFKHASFADKTPLDSFRPDKYVPKTASGPKTVNRYRKDYRKDYFNRTRSAIQVRHHSAKIRRHANGINSLVKSRDSISKSKSKSGSSESYHSDWYSEHDRKDPDFPNEAVIGMPVLTKGQTEQIQRLRDRTKGILGKIAHYTNTHHGATHRGGGGHNHPNHNHNNYHHNKNPHHNHTQRATNYTGATAATVGPSKTAAPNHNKGPGHNVHNNANAGNKGTNNFAYGNNGNNGFVPKVNPFTAAHTSTKPTATKPPIAAPTVTTINTITKAPVLVPVTTHTVTKAPSPKTVATHTITKAPSPKAITTVTTITKAPVSVPAHVPTITTHTLTTAAPLSILYEGSVTITGTADTRAFVKKLFELILFDKPHNRTEEAVIFAQSADVTVDKDKLKSTLHDVVKDQALLAEYVSIFVDTYTLLRNVDVELTQLPEEFPFDEDDEATTAHTAVSEKGCKYIIAMNERIGQLQSILSNNNEWNNYVNDSNPTTRKALKSVTKWFNRYTDMNPQTVDITRWSDLLVYDSKNPIPIMDMLDTLDISRNPLEWVMYRWLYYFYPLSIVHRPVPSLQYEYCMKLLYLEHIMRKFMADIFRTEGKLPANSNGIIKGLNLRSIKARLDARLEAIRYMQNRPWRDIKRCLYVNIILQPWSNHDSLEHYGYLSEQLAETGLTTKVNPTTLVFIPSQQLTHVKYVPYADMTTLTDMITHLQDISKDEDRYGLQVSFPTDPLTVLIQYVSTNENAVSLRVVKASYKLHEVEDQIRRLSGSGLSGPDKQRLQELNAKKKKCKSALDEAEEYETKLIKELDHHNKKIANITKLLTTSFTAAQIRRQKEDELVALDEYLDMLKHQTQIELAHPIQRIMYKKQIEELETQRVAEHKLKLAEAKALEKEIAALPNPLSDKTRDIWIKQLSKHISSVKALTSQDEKCGIELDTAINAHNTLKDQLAVMVQTIKHLSAQLGDTKDINLQQNLEKAEKDRDNLVLELSVSNIQYKDIKKSYVAAMRRDQDNTRIYWRVYKYADRVIRTMWVNGYIGAYNKFIARLQSYVQVFCDSNGLEPISELPYGRHNELVDTHINTEDGLNKLITIIDEDDVLPLLLNHGKHGQHENTWPPVYPTIPIPSKCTFITRMFVFQHKIDTNALHQFMDVVNAHHKQVLYYINYYSYMSTQYVADHVPKQLQDLQYQFIYMDTFIRNQGF